MTGIGFHHLILNIIAFFFEGPLVCLVGIPGLVCCATISMKVLDRSTVIAWSKFCWRRGTIVSLARVGHSGVHGWAGHLLVVHSAVAPHIVVLPVEVVHLSSIGSSVYAHDYHCLGLCYMEHIVVVVVVGL